MPHLEFTLSRETDQDSLDRLLSGGSRIVATRLDKAERFVMVSCKQAPMLFGGEAAPAAFVELRSLGGLEPDVNVHLSSDLCDLLYEVAGIPTDRVFLNFVDVERANWGWNRKTFAK